MQVEHARAGGGVGWSVGRGKSDRPGERGKPGKKRVPKRVPQPTK